MKIKAGYGYEPALNRQKEESRPLRRWLQSDEKNKWQMELDSATRGEFGGRAYTKIDHEATNASSKNKYREQV